MITLTYDDGGLSVNLEQAPQVIGLSLQRWMTRVVAHLHQAAARNMAGGLIGRRSGNLLRALTDRVTVSAGGEIIGELLADPDKAIYGAIQEEGGTIVPRQAQALAIPLDAMLTGNGVARGSARDVRDNPEAFGFSHTFVRKGGTVVFGIPIGAKGGSVVPLFALKPSVTIPGRHYLQITLAQEWNWIADELERVTGDAVHVLFGEGATAV